MIHDPLQSSSSAALRQALRGNGDGNCWKHVDWRSFNNEVDRFVNLLIVIFFSSLNYELMSNFFTGIAGEENEQKSKAQISRVQISGLLYKGDEYVRDRKSWKMKGTVFKPQLYFSKKKNWFENLEKLANNRTE